MNNSALPLNNGMSLPMLGLGVYKITDQNQMNRSVSWAMEAGYRLFDTAQMYGNEALLGNALACSGADRNSYFLTSKLEPANSSDPAAALMKSLEALKTDYLDLFLIHWPGQRQERLVRVWQQLEELHDKGLVRTLGVSNCTQMHLQWILDRCRILPAVHQVEHNPLLHEKDLYQFCREQGIRLQAWAPLMRGSLEYPVFQEMARRYEKSVAQLLLRWNIQQGFAVVPKSCHRERIFQNADIFDFALTQEDLALLNQMHIGRRTGKNPDLYDYE